MSLPSDAQARKDIPLCTGVLDYFPDALAEVALCSKAGNDQHNPGEPLHWAKEKSTDHANCILRHQVERGTRDKDGIRHSAKVAWRALAQLQIELDNERTIKVKPATVPLIEYLLLRDPRAQANGDSGGGPMVTP